MLERQFRFRHARTRLDLERHAPYRGQAPWRIAMTGATGMLGTQLSAFLTTGGHTVVPLVRREVRRGEAAIYWDPERGVLDPADLEGFDAVIHLAGENIAGGRWTPERKARILGSREAGTRLLGETLARLERKPRVWISASGAGFYGDRGDEVLTEASAGGRGFLADVCRAWEAGTVSARDAGIRVVNLRIGVVMTPSGGALAKQLIPYELGLGGPVGTGRQCLSWIDEDDLMGVVLHALHTDSLEGPVNATSPEPVQSAGFARALGHVLHRPAVMPLPTPAVLALFGEMGQEALLEGQRVMPQRLLDTGFRFAHPNLEAALGYQLGRSG
ncbi:Epimerase family protein [compost metagenome]